MRLIDKRIAVICNELRRLSVKQTMPVTTLVFKKGNFITPAEADAAPGEWLPFDSTTMHWYGPDQHYWFRMWFTVPQNLAGKSLWLHVRTQIDEWDDGKNPQFLLFLNDAAVQGIDMNHRDVLLFEKASEGERLCLDLQAYTGTLHSEFRLIIEMREVDPLIENLYYDLWVPLSAFARMEEEDKTRLELETVLNNAVNLLDLRDAHSDPFVKSVEAADAYLQQALYTEMAGDDGVIASCIGHTHIDVAWWWTVEQTREKVARSFATVLKLMEEYPDYCFMSSQPQLYQFLKERYPELYTRLKARVAEGRWEPEGGMWVEADCNVTSGESLVRQFVYGKRFFQEEFGVDCKILWLPDVFGYSGALPQIMRKAGIEYFMTTKLSWNQFNKIPYDTFRWRGIDGSEVFVHFITTLGIGQEAKNFFTTYNGMLHPDAIMGGWERYQNKEMNNDLLIAFGYGDGGGGPTREMLETASRLKKGVKGIPKVRQVFARTYFDELYARVKEHKRLPTWEGELYFEYHRGTYTSMARNKRANRRSEFGLMDAEFLGVLAAKALPYPQRELEEMWRTVLLNQFHDILPGTSIHEVYEVTKGEYGQIERMLDILTGERLAALTPPGDGVTVFNTTGFQRGDIVALGDCDAGALIDAEGAVHPVQQTEEGAVAYLPGLPAKGWKTFAKGAASPPCDVFSLEGNILETPFYRVAFDEQGLLSSLFDKENRREVLQRQKPANLFRMYEDKPIYYDNWDIDVYYTEKYWDVTDLQRYEWIEQGPVRATLALERRASKSLIRQKIHFYAKSRRIDFVTEVDWKERQHLLKVHFPVQVHSDEATFDIQFGNLTRKTHHNTSWDLARFESCGQKWVDVSEGHYGVSLLNDCKYGYSIHDGDLALTLIKSGIEPNPVTDQEKHVFAYALYPHAGTWRGAGTVSEAYNLNQPAYVVEGGRLGNVFSLAAIDVGNVVLETIKQAEDGDGVIVRLYECENALTEAELTWNGVFTRADECDLLEREERTLAVTENRISLTMQPYEIKTIRIR